MNKTAAVIAIFIAMALCSFVSAALAEKPTQKSPAIVPPPVTSMPVVVSNIWAKTTVPGSAVSAAYMQIQSEQPIKLIKVEATIANMVEIHSMQMKEGVMEMNEVEAVDIPAKKLIELKPGGLHVMLMQVKQPIKNGDKIPLTLTFEGAHKKLIRVKVEATAQDKNKQP